MIERRCERLEDLVSPVGLIAGNGTLPLQFAERARELGLKVVCVAHKTETDPSIEEFCDELSWVKVGQLGATINTLHARGCRQVAFAGGIRRVRLFGGVKLDWLGVRLLARLSSFRDDAVLRGIAEEVERHGIEVISPALLLDKCLPKVGVMTSRGLSDAERSDARLGFEVARRIGELDIGQAVITFQGTVLAVEAIEGTDAAILRAGELAKVSSKGEKERGAVVVKLCKPQQDLRFDLPTVGEATIDGMIGAGASALVVEAGKTIVLDPTALVKKANESRIAVCAVNSVEEI